MNSTQRNNQYNNCPMYGQTNPTKTTQTTQQVRGTITRNENHNTQKNQQPRRCTSNTNETRPKNTTNSGNSNPVSNLKVISYNAQGLKSKTKRAKVINWAMKKTFDTLAIQESHYIELDEENLKEHWKGKIYSSSGSNNSRGVTFLISENLG